MKYFLFFILFSIMSCSNSNNNLMISEDKFIDITADIYIANAYLEGENQVLKDSMNNIYRKQIFDKYGITRVDYDSTLAILSRQPKRMQKIYDKVILKIKK